MENLPIITGGTGLILTLCVLVCGFAFVLFGFWIYFASLIHAFRKTNTEFPDRVIWITLLIGSNFVGLTFFAGIVYYFLFKPSLKFWKKEE